MMIADLLFSSLEGGGGVRIFSHVRVNRSRVKNRHDLQIIHTESVLS